MIAADTPHAREQKLLVLETKKIRTLPFDGITDFVRPGDLWIVNDAATFPASLHGTARGQPVEIRLLPKPPGKRLWQAALFGAGDWHQKTEERSAPPFLSPGKKIRFADGVEATVVAISELSPRLITIDFGPSEAAAWSAIYRHGKPVQYSYARAELDLWSVQTGYASRPWASEMPSAGRPLSRAVLVRIEKAGARVATLTHATGLSSTGDPSIDSALPLEEFYDIPGETVESMVRAKRRGGRVIAVGTSVTRAIEGSARANGGALRPGPGSTGFKISSRTPIHWFDGILTGIHEAHESHFRLLEAFAPRELLERGLAEAEREGFRVHEFGDSALVFRSEGS